MIHASLKTSKRTMQHNPWITHSIIVSIEKCHELYKLWVKARKIICKKGEKDTKGGSCFCDVCSEKRTRYTKYQNYRRTLKKVRENAKNKYNIKKFKECNGNIKKTCI